MVKMSKLYFFKIVAFLMFWLVFYLAGSFIVMDFNVSNWLLFDNQYGRACFVGMFLVIAVLAFIIEIETPTDEK